MSAIAQVHGFLDSLKKSIDALLSAPASRNLPVGSGRAEAIAGLKKVSGEIDSFKAQYEVFISSFPEELAKAKTLSELLQFETRLLTNLDTKLNAVLLEHASVFIGVALETAKNDKPDFGWNLSNDAKAIRLVVPNELVAQMIEKSRAEFLQPAKLTALCNQVREELTLQIFAARSSFSPHSQSSGIVNNGELERQLADYKARFEKLELDSKVKEGQVQAELKEVRDRLTALTAEKADISADLKISQKTVSDKEAEILDLKTRIANIQEKLEQADKLSGTRLEEINTLKGELATLKEKVRNLDERLKEAAAEKQEVFTGLKAELDRRGRSGDDGHSIAGSVATVRMGNVVADNEALALRSAKDYLGKYYSEQTANLLVSMQVLLNAMKFFASRDKQYSQKNPYLKDKDDKFLGVTEVSDLKESLSKLLNVYSSALVRDAIEVGVVVTALRSFLKSYDKILPDAVRDFKESLGAGDSEVPTAANFIGKNGKNRATILNWLAIPGPQQPSVLIYLSEEDKGLFKLFSEGKEPEAQEKLLAMNQQTKDHLSTQALASGSNGMHPPAVRKAWEGGSEKKSELTQ